jgi:mannose-6-phosphate isomerase-like protein (cupin superfamily)
MPGNLNANPIHLGLGATAWMQPEFTGDMAWYEEYSKRNAIDGDEGRLVSLHRFDESWTSWEMHPAGSEVVICTQGTITLIQQFPDDTLKSIILNADEYAINPLGVWHTADVVAPATALFITAGAGTQHRAR